MSELDDIQKARQELRNAQSALDHHKALASRAPWNETYLHNVKIARADVTHAKRVLQQTEDDYRNMH